MADFVAVIRRAVDGLADNTPELRAKVYDKARGAIRRQLENMTPPPPAALVEKQLEKLEAAIREVEEENTEALPDPEAPAAAGGFSFDEEQDVPPPAPAVVPAPRAPEVKAAPDPTPAPSSLAGSAPTDAPPAMQKEAAPEPVPAEMPSADSVPAAARKSGPLSSSSSPSVSSAGPSGSSTLSPASVAGVKGPKPSRVEMPAARREPGFEPDQDARPEGILPDPEDDPVVGPQHDEVFGLKPEPRAATAGKARAARKVGSPPRASRGKVQPFLIAALVLIVLGSAGYGLWINRDGFLDSGASSTASSAGAESGGASDSGAGSEQASLPTAQKPSGTSTSPSGGADAGEAHEKFTQRLQADGSEIDPGPAPETGAASPDEGRTVTAQTDAPKTATPSSGAIATAAAEAPSAAAPPGSTAATAAQKPAGVSQKMFLYEERLGQQAPSAIEGTVVWSLASESPGGDAVPEPAIHGEISVPDKGMTALVTIKRNADDSLPASHLIEIVFALPGNFEGGGIQSIQRVAMKQTEQDQGNPLIAVPAKITDDFFMVALNDYPDAVKTNTELLRTRNWIDIPITYGNSRRALLTLEKGSSGAEVFDKALRAWAAKTPAPTTTTTNAPAGAQAPASGSNPADAATPGQ